MAYEQTRVVRGLVENERFEFRFPNERELDQDQEWCQVRVNGEWSRLRFHDYHQIYEVPGLYESLFYRALRCNSPGRVVGLLREVLQDTGASCDDLRALDVGAGNGMVGDALRNLGADTVVGVDIIEEARQATRRDRPWVYDDYMVLDLCDLPERAEAKLRRHRFNCMTTVAALGFGDIPPQAFLTALDLIEENGWLAFNIKEDFIHSRDDSGFARVLQQLGRENVIRIEAYRRYRHRFSTAGQPLHYVAMVATKQRHLPDHFRDVE